MVSCRLAAFAASSTSSLLASGLPYLQLQGSLHMSILEADFSFNVKAVILMVTWGKSTEYIIIH